MQDLILTIVRNDDGTPFCLSLTMPGKHNRRRSIARIYRDGIRKYDCHVRGKGQYDANNPYTAVGYAVGSASPTHPCVPDSFFQIIEQFDAETLADAVESDELAKN